MNENKNLSEQVTDIPSGLTDERKENVKPRKDVNEPAERSGETGATMPDDQLEAVAGGVVIPPPKVEDAAYMVTATAECKNCHHTFNYKYYYEEGGIPNGPWNHPVPDYCPECDPNVPHDR